MLRCEKNDSISSHLALDALKRQELVSSRRWHHYSNAEEFDNLQGSLCMLLCEATREPQNWIIVYVGEIIPAVCLK